MSRMAIRRRFFLPMLCCCVVSLSPGSKAQSAEFIPLGDLPGGRSDPQFWSLAYGISDDGSTVVGVGTTHTGRAAFRWSQEDGLISLRDFREGDSSFSFGRDASADGSVVVGTSLGGFRWTKETGHGVVGGLYQAKAAAVVFAVSADGNTVAGISNSQAMVWSAESGATGLGILARSPTSKMRSEAHGISADGTVLVGRTTSQDGEEGFRWTAETGMIGLGDLPGGNYYSDAHGISANGTTIVGVASSSEHELEAFRWDEGDGMVALGALPSHVGSEAYAVSGDGSVIVGASYFPLPVIEHQAAFIWTEATGMQSLQDVLDDAGVDLTGWELLEARGVSADGTHIAGSGINPDGNLEAWLAVLPVPEPPTCLLVLFCALKEMNKRQRELGVKS